MANIGIDSGELRHRVTVYAPPIGLDAYGQPLDAEPSMDLWEPVVSRWAKIESNTGAPYVQNDQIRNLSSHRITMRHLASINAGHRIVFQNRIFNVVGLITSEERNIDTVVACQEVIMPTAQS